MNLKKIGFIGDLRSIHLQRYIHWFLKKYKVFCITDFPVQNFYFNFKNLKIYCIPQKIKIPILRHLIQIFKIKKILKKEKPDIINAHFITEDGWYAVFSGFRPVIITIYGSDLYVSPKTSKFYKFLHKITLKKTNKIIAVSKHQLLKLKNYIKNFENKVFAIQYGVNLSKIKKINHQKLLKIKKELHIKRNDFVILSPRRLFPVYNIEIILKSYTKFLRKVKNSKLIILGDGILENKLKEKAKKLKIEKNTIFTGKILPDDMKYYYTLSDVVVSIPSSEGMPLTILEAMAIGVPIIATNLPSLKEIIKNEENGFLISKDANKLFEKIYKLYKNKKMRKKFGMKSKKFINENYNFNIQMQKIEKIFLQTIKK